MRAMDKRQLNDLKVFLVLLGIAALVFFSNEIMVWVLRLISRLFKSLTMICLIENLMKGIA